ncbi:MAG TPA: flagellar biosynthetic protein FliR [Ramlibacter sp.]|nr:flagellar biosynthetic protein FliR [Ramlibacter sp.]
MQSLVPALDSSWLATVFLLSLRLGAAFGMTPLLGRAGLPGSARMLLALSLAAALSLALPLTAVPATVTGHLGHLFVAAFSELAIGASLGLGIQLAFAAFSLAGRLLDTQVGFGMGQILDPMSNVKASILTTAFDQLAVLMFFLLNVHHVLLRGVAWSLERFPLGQPWPLSAGLVPLLKQVSAMFTLGFALAAPVVFCVLLVELALGVMAHSLPQMNMLMVGLPVKIVVGVLALALWAPEMGGVFSRIYQSIFSTWSQMLGSAVPSLLPRWG